MHKKYTYKDGKRFGPYYYETKRVDGHVVTTYLGNSPPKNKDKFLLKNVFIFSAFIFILLSLYFVSFNFTSNASLDIQTDYVFGDSINGEFKLNLFHGELIPADSIVLVSYGNFSKEFVLSDLVSDEVVFGEFYVDGISLSGDGQGYGLPGKIVEYPILDFEFSINGGESEPVNVETEETLQGENVDNSEPVNIKTEETLPEEPQIEESSFVETQTEEEKPQASDSILTGAIISDLNIVEGQVSKDNPFSYDLNGDVASLVSGSVSYDGNSLDDEVIEFESSSGLVIVTTDYLIEKEGFGKDYVSEEILEIPIDVAVFGLVADREDSLTISLIYQDNIIVESSEEIYILNNDAQENEKVADNLDNETIIGNTTQINQTVINETIIEVKTTQFNAIIGKPVRWVKTVSLDRNNSLNLIVEIPASAENVTINKIGSDSENVIPVQDSNASLVVGITGEVTAEFDLRANSNSKSLFSKIIQFFKFTGNVIGDLGTDVQEISVELQETDLGVEVEYYTEAPVATETPFKDNLKTIYVSSPEGIHYDNVLVFTTISDDWNIRSASSVLVEWVENNSFLEIYSINDNNLDGNYDYIEWIAPHLSNQTFNIIVITNALHLDGNLSYISNIYNETKELDDVWSEPIQNEHYVRVKFEINLTSVNDITIFPRIIEGVPIIEVYEVDSYLKIAEFNDIMSNQYNKIFLTNLTNSQDTFDLKIVGGVVEFDHIIDPNQGPGVFVLISPINGSSTTARSVNLTMQINDSDWVSGSSGSMTLYADTESPMSYKNIIYGSIPFTLNGTLSFNYSIPPLKYNSTQGMFLLYHFDNNSIHGENLTRVTDFATSRFNATYVNVNGDRERSKDGLGLAYEIDSNERITVLDDPLLNSPNKTGEFSAVFWFNLSAASAVNAAPSFIEKQITNVNRDYLIYFLNSSKEIRLAIGNGSLERQVPAITTISYDTWYHYAVTYNRSSNNVTIYLNGQVDRSLITATTVNTLVDTTASLHIAGSSSALTSIGMMDDVALFNKTLSGPEVLNMYRLKEGVYHLQANVSDNAGVYNSSSIYTFNVISNNIPYNGTSLVINSTLGLNRTAENLNVRTTLLDLDNHTMNVTATWYKNGLFNLTVPYNLSYSNGTTFIATLGAGNTTKNQNWSATLTINDGRSSFSVNSSNITILNSPPVVTLISPVRNTITINRTNQLFKWYSSDDDGDSISNSQIKITSVPVSVCEDVNYNGLNEYDSELFQDIYNIYTIQPNMPLKCLYDNGDQYTWTAKASDGLVGGQGSYPTAWEFQVNAYLEIVSNISSVQFGNLENQKSNDTGDNSPGPLIIANNGNAYSNILVQATNLWNTVSNPSHYFQIKVDNVSSNGISQNGTFLAGSIINYLNVSSSQSIFVYDLNYSSNKNMAEFDINVTVPTNEGPGVKNSVITFTAELGIGETSDG